jgi:hypothetical protein
VLDLPVGTRFGVTDVKDWLHLTNNPQLAAFHRYAVEDGLRLNLVIGPRTKSISAPLLDNIRGVRGIVSVFDSKTGKFTVLDIGTTGPWNAS